MGTNRERKSAQNRGPTQASEPLVAPSTSGAMLQFDQDIQPDVPKFGALSEGTITPLRECHSADLIMTRPGGWGRSGCSVFVYRRARQFDEI